MKWLIACLLISSVTAMPAAADLVLNQEDVTWTTDAGLVTFQMRFHNTGFEFSQLSTGEIYAQPFGAFVESTMPIGTFDIPPTPPESFFDVFVEIPYDQLPPTAAEDMPWDKDAKDLTCPKDWHWDGNVDVIWVGPGGGGAIQVHNATLQVCPGFGGSYIHLVTNCVGNAGWNIAGLCAGFTATLENEDHSPAPSPLPPGWTGFLAVSAPASTPLGTVCCFTVNFTCFGITIPVNLCVTACDCSPIQTKLETWGTIKALFK